MRTMFYRPISIISIFLILCFFTACSKENVIIENRNISSDYIVSFENKADYYSTMNLVIQMNENELKKYEEARGYTSLGRLSEEFYKKIKLDDFKTMDEIKCFIEENSNFLQLIEDENHELYLETKFYNRTDRYFLNKHNIFQIGDSVYKILKTGTVIASSKKIDIIYQVGDDIGYYMQDPSYIFIPNSDDNIEKLKGTTSDCSGPSFSWSITDDRDRLKVEIEVSSKGIYATEKHIECHFIQRPYKKTLGIWYWCSRTMKADINLNFTWLGALEWSGDCHNYIWGEGNLQFYQDYTMASKFEKTVYITQGALMCASNAQFSSYDVWSDTYSVPEINIECY